MAVVFRTVGPWGSGLGRNLMPEEVDNNFWELLQRIVELEENLPTAAEIVSFNVTGATFTVELSDATVLGPYQLPIASFEARGPYAAATIYNELDVITVPGRGVYLSLHEHTAPAEFNPDLTQEGNPVYTPLYVESDMYEVHGFVLGLPGTGVPADGLMFIHQAARQFYVPSGAVGSYAFVERSPTDGSIAYPIYRAPAGGLEYVQVGELAFPDGELEGTVVMAGLLQMQPGDRLLVGPALEQMSESGNAVVVNPTARDLSFVIVGVVGIGTEGSTESVTG